jgi:hypothetical protein
VFEPIQSNYELDALTDYATKVEEFLM